MRLTEEKLGQAIARHVAECERCEVGDCEEPNRIEAAFLDEVDRRIDAQIEDARR